MSLFITYIKNKKSKIIILLLLTLFNSLSLIPIPYLSKYLVDVILLSKKYEDIWLYIIIIVVVMIFQLIFGRISVKFSAKFFQQFLYEIRKKIFKNYFSCNEGKSSVLSTIILSDSELYVNNVSIVVTTVLANVFTGISYVFVMVLISWKLAMITFLFIPAYIIWIAYISVKLEILAEKQQISKDSLLKEVNNYISSKEVIKIFNFFRIVVQSFDKVIIKNKRLNIKMLTYQNFINIVSGVIVTAASVVPLLVGVNLVKGGNMTIGDLIAFNSYSGLLFSPITQLIGTLANVRVANVYKTRIEAFDFQHEARKIKNVDDNITEIKLENLSIYSEKQLILKGINLNIHNGDWVRLYGANGSGKSLFLKTVAKLYTDYKGEISINSEVNSTIVNKKIVYISSIHGFPLQNLYQEMTASNTVDHIEIVNVLKLVGLSDKISHLKENIFTSNSEIVEKFSTGELQKLRLARALIRKPDFLFLDEIFSNIELTQAVDILKKIHCKYPDLSLILVEHHFPYSELFKKELHIENKTIVIP